MPVIKPTPVLEGFLLSVCTFIFNIELFRSSRWCCIIGQEWNRFRLGRSAEYKHYAMHTNHTLLNLFHNRPNDVTGNTKGGSITVPLTSFLIGLELAVWQLKILFLFAKQTNPNQSKKEVNGTVILPPLVFLGCKYHLLLLKRSISL